MTRSSANCWRKESRCACGEAIRPCNLIDRGVKSRLPQQPTGKPETYNAKANADYAVNAAQKGAASGGMPSLMAAVLILALAVVGEVRRQRRWSSSPSSGGLL